MTDGDHTTALGPSRSLGGSPDDQARPSPSMDFGDLPGGQCGPVAEAADWLGDCLVYGSDFSHSERF